MTDPRHPAFDPATVAESNATAYPAPLDRGFDRRFNRRLGDHAGLRNIGVVMTRIRPGGRSSHRHAHSRRDEFVYVLEGTVMLETDGGAQELKAGLCVGFPAGSGDAHRFVNRSSADAVLLVVGDRAGDDVVSYPDADFHAVMDGDGPYKTFRKDGTPY